MSEALPLRSATRRILPLADHEGARLRAIVRTSVAAALPTLRGPRGAQQPPEFVVGATFGDPHNTREFGGFLSTLVPVPPAAWGGAFVRQITDGILFERQTGLPGAGARLRAGQDRLGEDAMLVGITGVMGLRSNSASIGEQPGILAFTYMGDGQLCSGLFSNNGKVLRAALIAPPQNDEERAAWGVRFGNEQVVDVGGDLAHLYSALTADSTELALLF